VPNLSHSHRHKDKAILASGGLDHCKMGGILEPPCVTPRPGQHDPFAIRPVRPPHHGPIQAEDCRAADLQDGAGLSQVLMPTRNDPNTVPGSGFQNLSRAISKAMGKNTKEKKEEKTQKKLMVCFCYCVLGNGTQLCGCSTDDLYIWIFVRFWSSDISV
jgi:hypothetical protein